MPKGKYPLDLGPGAARSGNRRRLAEPDPCVPSGEGDRILLMSTRHPLAQALEWLAILTVLGLTLIAMLLWTLEESRVRDGEAERIVSTAVRGAGALLDLTSLEMGADGTP